MKYVVKSPINLDGKRREIDEQVEIKSEVAEGLLMVGAIAPTASTEPARKDKGNKE